MGITRAKVIKQSIHQMKTVLEIVKLYDFKGAFLRLTNTTVIGKNSEV